MSYKQNNPLSRKNSPLNKDDKWIQKATESIKERGTEGVCTGDKFGGPTCPPGSKRYNLAKTFKKMAKKRKDGPSRKSSESDWLKYGGDVIDETAQKDEGMSRHGSMKGDQSATHVDYANYKGTDKGYHGHTGASHGDQSATHRDYMTDHRHSPLNNTGMTGLNYSKELRYMPIEDDMHRGMSRNSSSPLDYGSWAAEDSKRAKKLYKEGHWEHAHDLGIDEHDADYAKHWHRDEAEHGPSRKSRSERLRGRAMKRSERTGAEWGDYDWEDPRVQKLLQKANKLDERSGKEMKMTKSLKNVRKS